MKQKSIKALVLNAGTVSASALVLNDPLSFWGGFDPKTGEILDRHHPQAGQSVAGTVMVIPASRGSAGTPAGVAESIRRGSGPAAVVLGETDVNITIGAMVADRLYGTSTPVVVPAREDYARIRSSDSVTIDEAGNISVTDGNEKAQG